MKSIFLSFCLLVSFFCTGQSLKVMSYNIRYDNPDDGPNQWNERRSEVVSLLQHYRPGIFGIQEGLVHQLAYMDQELKTYTYVGVGRDDGKEKGEYAAIFYDSTRYTLLRSSTFWLSETPQQISVGWDAALERICTYGQFQDKNTKSVFWVYNAHYDHRGETSRVMASKLILSQIQELNKRSEPVFLIGDFNSRPDSEPIQTLKGGLSDGGALALKGIYGPVGTFNSFKKDHALDGRIDYIFVKGLSIKKYSHIDDRRKNHLWVSDHLPVMIEATVQ